MKQGFISQKIKDYALLDKHTGELLEYRQTKKVGIDEFIMVFFSSIPKILDLKGTQIKVLMCCWKYSSFNPLNTTQGNTISNNKMFKSYIRECGFDTTDDSINNAICALCKKGLLIKRCKGEYMLNPEYFFKGTIAQRSKLKFSVEVDPQCMTTEDNSICFLGYSIKSITY